MQFELHALTELIANVESQDFLGTGLVTEPKKVFDKVVAQRAQRLHARTHQLSVRPLSWHVACCNHGAICMCDLAGSCMMLPFVSGSQKFDCALPHACLSIHTYIHSHLIVHPVYRELNIDITRHTA